MSRELYIKAYIKAIAESQTAWRHGRERNGPHLGLWPWTEDEGSCNRVYMPQFGLYLTQTVLYGGLWKGRETLTYKGSEISLSGPEFARLWALAKEKVETLLRAELVMAHRETMVSLLVFLEPAPFDR